ncbi:MAG: MlaD family protein [Treponema sp.]|jgi:phospholipid/cholesterol/gamma-HCH transport system substrate-binding protein|nr:MlaD family protein [Treponema sp.]
MKFRIRFADQIVGVLIMVALFSLIFVLFMLGRSQRWFTKDYTYKTYFDTAAGLSGNMPVQYKGFTIGNVRSYRLTEGDRVEVVFFIYEAYIDRVKTGSLVDINVSPIGLGSQFRFHPGLGQERLTEGALVPSIHSTEGKQLIQSGLAAIQTQDDSITLLVNRINVLLEDVDRLILTVGDALKGTDTTSLGRIFGELEATIAQVQGLAGTVNQDLNTVMAEVQEILEVLHPIIANVDTLSHKVVAPDGLVSRVLDTQDAGSVYASLEASLQSVSKILRNLDKTSDILPRETAGLLRDVRTTLKTLEDVLVALTNNPLLKKGIPPQVQTQSPGTSPRDIGF